MELAAKDSISGLLTNLQSLHLWLNVKGNPTITRNFNIFLHVLIEVPRSISIPEKGNMTKFNCLTVQKKKKKVMKKGYYYYYLSQAKFKREDPHKGQPLSTCKQKYGHHYKQDILQMFFQSMEEKQGNG